MTKFLAKTDPFKLRLYWIFVFILFLNIGVWQYSHRQQPKWSNVPKPPQESTLAMSFLGDQIFAYRASALVLQNFGNIGSNVAPLKDYNYDYLSGWFHLLDEMDPKSSVVPLLAAYYFSSTQNPEQLRPLIAYLEEIGSRSASNNWRWLVQAVFLARHRLQDMPEALRLSKKLASLYRQGMPAWVLYMPALISGEVGDRQAARDILIETLRSSAETLDPNEVAFMVRHLCNDILTNEEKTNYPFCQ